MKKFLLSSLIAAAAAVPALAGVDNINYQAVIKNGNEVVADKKVSLKFELLDKSEKVVYSEVQYPTTNAAGYVYCQLGQEGDLSTIEWDDLTLSVSVDLGSGYQVVSSEAVSSVPTALYSLRSADTDALTEQVDAFANMVEFRFDKIQGQADASDLAIEQLTEQIDAFATMNETRLDKMQNQMDETDKAAEENYDDLKGSVLRNEQNISALQGKVNEFKDEYQEDWQSLAKFQEEISTDVNEFKDQYAEDWQSLTKFQEEISTDVNEFKDQYAEDWQSLTKFQEEISTDVNEFKDDYQESFQKMSEFQEGASTAINELNTAVEGLVKDNEETQSKLNSFGADIAQITGLAEKVELLENSLNIIANPNVPDSMMYQINAGMGDIQDQIDEIKSTLDQLIKALKELDILPTPFKAGK